MKRTCLPLHAALLLSLLASVTASAAEMFSLAVGQKEQLIIRSPVGKEVASLPPGTIQQPIKVGPISFTVSYGQDTNKLYSAIIAPDPNQPTSLNFSVVGNRIQADSKASVTVTFSSNLKSVSVDPGAFGSVTLNGNRLGGTVATASQKPATRPVSTTPKPKKTPTTVPSTSAPPVQTASTTPSRSANGSSGNGSSASRTAMAGSTASRLMTSAFTSTPSDVRFWAEPITPPSGRLPSITASQMKLVEVRGPVTVKLPNGRSARARNGMIIPSGSSVRTTSGSSAAVFIGGANSARLTENSTAKFNHRATSDLQKTTVDLTRGCVFSKVGNKRGVRQDYKVRTPSGIAAAKGTDFATVYRSNNMYVFVVAGRVVLFDLQFNILGEASTARAGQISVISTAAMSEQGRQDMINEIVDLANDNNSKINNILSKTARGIPLTDAEQTYLANVPTIGRQEYYRDNWDDLSYNPYWGIYYSIIPVPGSRFPTDSGYDPLYDILNQPTRNPESIFDQTTTPPPTTPF